MSHCKNEAFSYTVLRPFLELGGNEILGFDEEEGTGETKTTNTSSIYCVKFGAKEAHLRNATMYLDLTFREWFIGKKKNKEQSLEFPRIEISIIDTVPLHIINACCECACQIAKNIDLYAGNVPQIKR